MWISVPEGRLISVQQRLDRQKRLNRCWRVNWRFKRPYGTRFRTQPVPGIAYRATVSRPSGTKGGIATFASPCVDAHARLRDSLPVGTINVQRSTSNV